MDFINAQIESADVILEEPCGKLGLNCILELKIRSETGGLCHLPYAVYRIPQILKLLDAEKLSDLVGTYVKVSKIDIGEDIKAVKLNNIFGKDSEAISNDCDVYYGSEWTGLKGV